MDWQRKAHRIIAALCHASWAQANLRPDGTRRKRHVPYSVPDTAARLVRALGENDEHTAKSIFVHSYDVRGL